MPIQTEVLELENRNVGMNYEATLAEAYRLLKDQWDRGNRDRESCLHIAFIAWYGIIEPSHITGFTESDSERGELNQILFDVHEYFKTEITNDSEMLYVFGLMASMQWFMLERAPFWEQIGIDYRSKYRNLEPDGLDPSVFKDRGAYGEYFEMQAKVSKGPNGY